MKTMKTITALYLLVLFTQIAHASSCPSILDHGGNNNGTADNTTAFANTVAASPIGQVCVYLPAGTYNFNSTVTYTMPNSVSAITIEGDGHDVTNLVWPSGQGLQINYVGIKNYAHIKKLSILTGAANIGSGINLNQTSPAITNPDGALSDIQDVSIHGSDAYPANDYWSNGIQIYGVSNVNITNVTIIGSAAKQGTGLNTMGAALLPTVAFNIAGSTFINLGDGIIYGDYVQGMTISQSNFGQLLVAINSPPSATGLDQLTVANSQMECAGFCIWLESGIPSMQIMGNLFIIDGGACGILLPAAADYQIIGNSFQQGVGSPNCGVAITGSVSGGVITGNTFANMGNGIYLTQQSFGVNIQSNNYRNNSVNVGNLSTNNHIGGGSP